MRENKPFVILAVDDNLLNLKLIEKSLSKEGYQILTADNGKDGRKLATEKKPDLILLDIEMPDEDGFHVITRLKDDPVTASIPVIFLTGVKDVDSKLKGFELGAVDYITKPFHPMEVIARVSIHLKLSIAVNSMVLNQAEKLRQITDAQISMLPLPADYPDAKFGVFYRALEEAGGDFYDILNISDEIKGYFVADVSGHDIKASYMMASLKALLAQNCTPMYSPEQSMQMINAVLLEILPEIKYLTACYARLDRVAGKLILINAGHPPVVYLPLGEAPVLLKSNGDILGMYSNAQFGIHRVNVKKGDRFFMYTDGLVESAESKITWSSGAENFVPLFKEVRNTPVENAPRELMEKLLRAGFVYEDDIVLLCVEV